MTDTKWIAAAQKLQALGYEWKCDEWVKPALPEKFGCHVDLEFGDEPDGCVLDYGNPDDCVLARTLVAAGKKREDCREWRPVVFIGPAASKA